MTSLTAIAFILLTADPQRLAPVTGPNQEAGIKAVREIFADDFAKAKTPAEKTALSASLVKLAAETKDDQFARWGAYREAARLAAEAGNSAAVVSAIDATATHFEIDTPAEKLRAFRELPAPAQAEAAKAALSAAKDADRANAFDTAIGLVDFAATAALRGKDLATRDAAEKLREGLKVSAKDFEAAKEAKGAIDTDPTDKSANLAWGRYLALRRGDWAAGLPFLAKGNGDLATLAKDDLSSPKDPAGQLDLADLWWSFGEAEKDPRDAESLKARAGVWYGRALPGLSGLAKAKAEKRIAAPATAVAAPIELLKGLNIRKGTAAGEWRASGKFLGVENAKFARFEFEEQLGAEYRLTIDAEAAADRSTFGIYLPLPESRGVAVVLDNSKGSILAVDGSPVWHRETVFAGRKRTKIDCVVKRTSIEVLVNDKRILIWEGDVSKVKNDPGEGWMDAKGKVGLGAHGSTFLIRSAVVSWK